MEVQTLSLVQALVAGGHEVVTLCCFEHTESMKDEYMRAGARVVLMSPEGGSPTKGLSLVRNLFVGLREVIRGWHPDVAHVQYTAQGAIPVIFLRLLGIKKVVATAHTSADIHPSTGVLGFVARRLLTAFTCMTRRAEYSFFGSSSLYSPDTPLSKHGNHFTIYNSLPPYIEVTRSKRQFFWPPMMGVVSRLEEVKGMDLLVPAFALVHRMEPEVQLLVVGDGSLRPLMERQVRELGVMDCVRFLGRQPQDRLRAYYDSIDILLMPSRSEGFGLTAIEGMARGCVVVASSSGGLPEVVKDGETGVLHKPGDGDDIAHKVLSLIHDPAAMERLSQAAVRRAEEFTPARQAPLIRSLYDAIEKL